MTVVRCSVVVGCGLVGAVVSGLFFDSGPGLGVENVVGFIVAAAIALIVVRRSSGRG